MPKAVRRGFSAEVPYFQLLSGGLFQASYLGNPNLTYTIDRSTNLAGPWELGFTNITADTNGLFQVIDPNNPAAAMRF